VKAESRKQKAESQKCAGLSLPLRGFTNSVSVALFQKGSDMTRRVLSVGQCGPDHGALSRFLNSVFDVTIETATTATETFERLRQQPYDLVLINRKLDYDYSDGEEILRGMQADAQLKSLPVMLISNYPEAQANAVELGAVYGFGKDELGRSDVVTRLQPYLR